MPKIFQENQTWEKRFLENCKYSKRK
jgi:hypothetical protein